MDNRTTDWIQLNKGGCVAAASGEADEKGCGGSFELYGQCLNETCSGCFPIKTDTKALYACESDPQTDTRRWSPATLTVRRGIADAAVSRCASRGIAETRVSVCASRIPTTLESTLVASAFTRVGRAPPLCS